MSTLKKFQVCTYESLSPLPLHVLVRSKHCQQIRLFPGEKMAQPYIRLFAAMSNCARSSQPRHKIMFCVSLQAEGSSKSRLIASQLEIVRQKASMCANCWAWLKAKR